MQSFYRTGASPDLCNKAELRHNRATSTLFTAKYLMSSSTELLLGIRVSDNGLTFI